MATMFRYGRQLTLFLTGLIVTATSCIAQAPPTEGYTPTLTLDVISVRESKPDSRGFFVGGEFAGATGSLDLKNVDIQSLILMAYGLKSNHLDGLPDWTRQRLMYNVQARADEVTDAKLATLSKEHLLLEHQHMMQAMLEDRFHLQTHWETRQQPLLNLVVAKGGPKMQPGGSMPLSEEESKSAAAGTLREVHQRGDGRLGYELVGHNAHMKYAAQYFGVFMGMDVIDRTGLSGTYDFDLKYSQQSDAQREANPDVWPPIADAVHDQLGLSLKHTKGPVQVLVVDHIEPPSQN